MTEMAKTLSGCAPLFRPNFFKAHTSSRLRCGSLDQSASGQDSLAIQEPSASLSDPGILTWPMGSPHNTSEELIGSGTDTLMPPDLEQPPLTLQDPGYLTGFDMLPWDLHVSQPLDDAVSSLLSTDQQYGLIDLYFSHCHNQPYGLFEEDSFRQRFLATKVPCHLLLAITALSSRFATQQALNANPVDLACRCADLAWQFISPSCFSGADSLDIGVMQTLTLLCIYDFTGTFLTASKLKFRDSDMLDKPAARATMPPGSRWVSQFAWLRSYD